MHSRDSILKSLTPQSMTVIDQFGMVLQEGNNYSSSIDFPSPHLVSNEENLALL